MTLRTDARTRQLPIELAVTILQCMGRTRGKDPQDVRTLIPCEFQSEACPDLKAIRHSAQCCL